MWHTLQGVNLSVDSLQAAMRRVRAEVMGPYAAITAQTAQLTNLQATGDLLRHVLHHLKLVARLKVHAAAFAVARGAFAKPEECPLTLMQSYLVKALGLQKGSHDIAWQVANWDLRAVTLHLIHGWVTCSCQCRGGLSREERCATMPLAGAACGGGGNGGRAGPGQGGEAAERRRGRRRGGRPVGHRRRRRGPGLPPGCHRAGAPPPLAAAPPAAAALSVAQCTEPWHIGPCAAWCQAAGEQHVPMQGVSTAMLQQHVSRGARWWGTAALCIILLDKALLIGCLWCRAMALPKQ